MQQNPETIAAIATPHGSGGIGVVRVSGVNVTGIIHSVLRRPLLPRVATYASFFDDQGGLIDRGIAIYFPSPNSYTGEEVLELQAHGGPGVLSLLMRSCLSAGARIASPGEFTQRAFFNGKIDLVQAESIADLISATSEQAARSAARSLSGEYSQAITSVVTKITNLRIFVEGAIDFPEEVEGGGKEKQNKVLETILSDLEQIIGLATQGKVLREGIHVVLVGEPNVGKSSLLNRLAGEEVALVSDIAGTTRDAIHQLINIRGVPLHFFDTAGLRESEDFVEQLGVERTRQTIQKADVVLFMKEIDHEREEFKNEIAKLIPATTPRLFVINKADKLESLLGRKEMDEKSYIYISAKTGRGVEALLDKLLDLIGWKAESGAFMARERHLVALAQAREHLKLANLNQLQEEFFAEELRLAQECLGQITGEFTPDDLLGEIFSQFCLGK